MKQPGAVLQGVLEALDNVLQELKQFESRLINNRAVHKNTIPEIKETLTVISFLRDKAASAPDEPISTNFQLSASIFAQAKVDASQGKVVLWLGANTAAELTYDEAEKLLTKNLGRKQNLMDECDEDAKLAKRQITTTEVCIARVYNNDVKERRANAANAPNEAAAPQAASA